MCSHSMLIHLHIFVYHAVHNAGSSSTYNACVLAPSTARIGHCYFFMRSIRCDNACMCVQVSYRVAAFINALSKIETSYHHNGLTV